MPQLSYTITSLTSNEVNTKFRTAKKHFNLLYTQQKTKLEHFIMKNLAHVTLKRDFHLRDGIRDEEVASGLSSITFSPIPIEGTRLDIFETPTFGNVLVVLVEKHPDLQKLHEDLFALINPVTVDRNATFERSDFNPHLTILYNLPDERIDEATEYAKKQILPVTYTLESFRFMREVPGVVGEREMLKEYFARQ